MNLKTFFLLVLGILFLFDTIAQDTTENPNEGYFKSLSWRNIGPFRGGRSCAVTGVPGKPNLFYFGSTGGGIWKTKDGGRTWENISDGFFGGSIGAIAVSNSDHNVLYAGGGEKTVRGNVSFGYGVWKSVDAGKTWIQSGLKKSRHISRIRIHPDNPDIVYVAVMGDLFKSNEERGVYKSSNGGETWEKVLFANPHAGAVDLILDPTNPRILYASTWNVRRTPFSLSSGGSGSEFWKSTDSGKNWSNISGNEGLPKDTLGIIGIAVSPQKPDRVWAIIESKTGGVFRSDDGGEKWTKLNDERNLRQRAWYYTRIYADPADEDIVYVMNVRYHKSKDGGKTFTRYNAPHGDHHDLWIAPENPDRMIIGDDGGAQVTYDGGETWTTYHNQPTAQFYRVTTDDHFPYRIYAAQQDNSTIRIAHRTTGSVITDKDWETTAGCECAHIAVDPTDNDIVYGGCYDGFLGRKNHRTDENRIISVWPDNPMGHGAEGMRYRFNWNFPLFFSPHNSKRLYAASNHLHVSENEGQSWEIISPDLTRNDSTKLGPSGGPITKDNTSVEYYCTLFAVAESPLKEGVIWAGSDDGLLHVTKNGGSSWEKATPIGMPDWIMINSIEPDPYNEGGCYLAATNYKWGDYAPYLYKTEDYGVTWKKIVSGINREHFTRVVRADPTRKGLLYAGTESGVYLSFDDGKLWSPFQLNLPTVPITDLVIKNDNLIASTQGRGIWIIDDLTVLHQFGEDVKKSNHYLFIPEEAYRIGGSQNKNPKSHGKNHPGGVSVHFYLKELEDSTKVSLHFLDNSGKEIRSFSSKAKESNKKLKVEKGANLFVWNLHYPQAKKFDGMVLWWASLNGPKSPPGKYGVQLVVDTDTLFQEFIVKQDPRSGSLPVDIKAQFDFIQSITAKITEAHEAIMNIRILKKQLKDFTSRLDKEDETTKPLILLQGKIDSLFTGVENALYQTQNKSPQDPLNFPVKLTNKLGHLNSVSQTGDFRPTDQAVQVKEELSAKIDLELQKYNQVLLTDIPKFNELIRDLNVDVIKIPELEKED